ncbi:alpha/beta hydrolase [uncultured Kriegella sp.]|uniref:alpha/beta hydrolase n=1 Tax=uncultured Kriegella sp. TaxID=1798910 RepID=UPI0030DD8174
MKQITFLLLLTLTMQLGAQQTIDLYTTSIPNSKPSSLKEKPTLKNGRVTWIENVSKPTLTIFLPNAEAATGAAVIICPGGGYSGESYELEGIVIAEAFVRKGVAAFILKYRLPNDLIMNDKTIGPLQDAQQAIKTVRERAKEWQLDADKIGIIGFSAGGHLASTAGTHFEKSYISNDENTSLKPNFMILVYPVISMTDALTHNGSREKLLGKSAVEEQIKLFSNELHVKPNTPPTWLTHTGDDNVVSVENSIRFYQELVRNNVSAEMHLYPKGNHGFVLSLPTDQWMRPLFDWMNKSILVD